MPRAYLINLVLRLVWKIFHPAFRPKKRDEGKERIVPNKEKQTSFPFPFFDGKETRNFRRRTFHVVTVEKMFHAQKRHVKIYRACVFS